MESFGTRAKMLLFNKLNSGELISLTRKEIIEFRIDYTPIDGVVKFVIPEYIFDNTPLVIYMELQEMWDKDYAQIYNDRQTNLE